MSQHKEELKRLNEKIANGVVSPDDEYFKWFVDTFRLLNYSSKEIANKFRYSYAGIIFSVNQKHVENAVEKLLCPPAKVDIANNDKSLTI